MYVNSIIVIYLLQFLFSTVCGLSCLPGNIPDPTCAMCVLSNICEAKTPCKNNGVCIIGSQPYEYSCNCVNNFEGVNCTSE